MRGYRLSRKAETDLQQIYLYSFENFGETQADAYILELSSCLDLLTEQPRLGRVQPGKTEDRRAFFHGAHIIAYRITGAGILIQRVLDARSDWQRIFRRL
jgi:toxin ParE1/3/4